MVTISKIKMAIFREKKLIKTRQKCLIRKGFFLSFSKKNLELLMPHAKLFFPHPFSLHTPLKSKYCLNSSTHHFFPKFPYPLSLTFYTPFFPLTLTILISPFLSPSLSLSLPASAHCFPPPSLHRPSPCLPLTVAPSPLPISLPISPLLAYLRPPPSAPTLPLPPPLPPPRPSTPPSTGGGDGG